MDYGWLTESALLPKKSKDIKCSNSSYLALKNILKSERGRNNRILLKKRKAKKDIFGRKNKGVE